MKKFLVPIYLFLFLLSATAIWYFGHHRPAQTILKAGPKKVYKGTLAAPEAQTVEKQATADRAHPGVTLGQSATEIDGFSTPSLTPESTDTVGSDTIIQSQNDVERTLTPHEHTESQHSHSQEDLAAEAAEFEMIRVEIAEMLANAKGAIEATQPLLKEGARMIATHLNQMPQEEQRAFLNEYRNMIYSEEFQSLTPKRIRNLAPDLADQTWNLIVKSWTEQGYNIPSEWTELQ